MYRSKREGRQYCSRMNSNRVNSMGLGFLRITRPMAQTGYAVSSFDDSEVLRMNLEVRIDLLERSRNKLSNKPKNTRSGLRL